MKGLLACVFGLLAMVGFSQIPLYDFVSYKKTQKLPKELNSERSAVIFSIPPTEKDGFVCVGDYLDLIEKVHAGFVKMGVDAIIYLHDVNYTASRDAQQSYADIFSRRRVKNIIFLTKRADGFELFIAPFSGKRELISDGSDVFYVKAEDLYTLLVKTGKEIKRADLEQENFLIPDHPELLGGLSIVEKTALHNYPGILRRSSLAVERFARLDTGGISDPEVKARIHRYNQQVEAANEELAQIMKTYPYEYKLIDYMSDDDLKRNRYQFVLRSVRASAEIVKKMLDYEVLPSETDFISIIPILPDQTRTKTIPKDALVTKFYIRQNISKNVHVGEWDADSTWQEALSNMIGNLIQELNGKN